MHYTLLRQSDCLGVSELVIRKPAAFLWNSNVFLKAFLHCMLNNHEGAGKSKCIGGNFLLYHAIITCFFIFGSHLFWFRSIAVFPVLLK